MATFLSSPNAVSTRPERAAPPTPHPCHTPGLHSSWLTPSTAAEFRTQQPQRTPWVVPTSLRSSNKWLGKYSYKPRTKLFAKPLAPPGAARGGAGGAGRGVPPSSQTLQKSMFSSKATSMTVKVAGLGAVHEASGLQDGGIVLQERVVRIASTAPCHGLAPCCRRQGRHL